MSALFLPAWLYKAFTGKSLFGFANKSFKELINNAGSYVGEFNQGANQHLTGAENEANQFTAQQAEIARDWQERMYTQFESPEAQVRQYQDAGLNPALMYGHYAAGSVPSASTGGSSAGHSSVNPIGVFSDLINLFKAKAEIRNINADTDSKRASAEVSRASAQGQNIENQFKPDILAQQLKQSYLDYENTRLGMHLLSEQINASVISQSLDKAQINKILNEASLIDKQIATESLRQLNLSTENDLLAAQIVTEKVMPVYKAVEIALMKNNTDKVRLDVLHEQFDQEFRDTFGMLPDKPVWNSITGALGFVSRNTINGVMNIYDNVKSYVAKKRSKTN